MTAFLLPKAGSSFSETVTRRIGDVCKAGFPPIPCGNLKAQPLQYGVSKQTGRDRAEDVLEQLASNRTEKFAHEFYCSRNN